MAMAIIYKSTPNEEKICMKMKNCGFIQYTVYTGKLYKLGINSRVHFSAQMILYIYRGHKLNKSINGKIRSRNYCLFTCLNDVMRIIEGSAGLCLVGLAGCCSTIMNRGSEWDRNMTADLVKWLSFPLADGINQGNKSKAAPSTLMKGVESDDLRPVKSIRNTSLQGKDIEKRC